MRQWDKAQDYAYTQELDARQWAWEFLRRNADYQADWAWFQSCWSALEYDYGRAPQRDFQRWKQDARAFRENDAGDRLLIECWMGERWGLAKFPPNPQHDALQLGEALGWRHRPVNSRLLFAGDPLPATDSLHRVLDFDLGLPIAPQLEAARRTLAAQLQALRHGGAAVPHNVKNQASSWRSCLRILDAHVAGASTQAMAACLCEGNEEQLGLLRQKARALSTSGYLELLRLDGK